jgi:hypothetical protein
MAETAVVRALIRLAFVSGRGKQPMLAVDITIASRAPPSSLPLIVQSTLYTVLCTEYYWYYVRIW